jgi:hypothetical protein
MSGSQRQRPRALLILGMHRSGTSAATRVVNLLGAHIGANILLPGEGNLEGFWEHADAVHTNHYLLQVLGRTWFDIRQLPKTWPQHAISQKTVAYIKTLIKRDFDSYPLVAIKDPRMCLTAPVWIAAFEALGYEVQCLFVVRDPREVADSLQAREKWPREPIFLLWAHYMAQGLLATQQCRRSLITYDQLLTDWRGTIHRVSDELALTWPNDTEAAAIDVDAFLHVGHRHHKVAASNTEEKTFADMPFFVAEFYANCIAIADGRKTWSAVEQSASTFTSIAELYTTYLNDLLAQHGAAESKMKEQVQTFEKLLSSFVANAQAKP